MWHYIQHRQGSRLASNSSYPARRTDMVRDGPSLDDLTAYCRRKGNPWRKKRTCQRALSRSPSPPSLVQAHRSSCLYRLMGCRCTHIQQQYEALQAHRQSFSLGIRPKRDMRKLDSCPFLRLLLLMVLPLLPCSLLLTPSLSWAELFFLWCSVQAWRLRLPP